MKGIHAREQHQKLLLILLFSLVAQITFSQDTNWDVYLAQFDKGPGSVSLNMDLIIEAPKGEFPFVVITGVTFSQCRDDGFPEDEEFKKLYAISDNVVELISSISESELVGTFTYQCQRLDYVYVRDTTNIRDKLESLYKSHYKSYKQYINIVHDKEWEAYTKFLYPNEEIQEYMSNEKVLVQLRTAGDKLNKARQIDHWLYFSSSNDRDAFTKYAQKEKFKIEGNNYLKDSELPYQLHISRVDNLDPQLINSLTLSLRKKAKEFKGEYDGWETFVVKD